MNNVMLMKVVHRAQNFTDDSRCILLCEFSVLTNPVKQFTTSSQLRNNVVLVLSFCKSYDTDRTCGNTCPRLKPVHKTDYVGMIQSLEQIKLIVNHLLVSFDILLENDLHCDFSRRSVGFPNNPVGTSTLPRN